MCLICIASIMNRPCQLAPVVSTLSRASICMGTVTFRWLSPISRASKWRKSLWWALESSWKCWTLTWCCRTPISAFRGLVQENSSRNLYLCLRFLWLALLFIPSALLGARLHFASRTFPHAFWKEAAQEHSWKLLHTFLERAAPAFIKWGQVAFLPNFHTELCFHFCKMAFPPPSDPPAERIYLQLPCAITCEACKMTHPGTDLFSPGWPLRRALENRFLKSSLSLRRSLLPLEVMLKCVKGTRDFQSVRTSGNLQVIVFRLILFGAQSSEIKFKVLVFTL